MKSNILIIGLLTFTFLTFYSCKDEETPPVENEEELITTVNLKFTDVAAGAEFVFTFRDTDGPGGNAPEQFDTIQLGAMSEYVLEIELLNESESPAEDITEEVEEEGADHQFFFTPEPASLLSITYDDADTNGDPIGLLNTVMTNAADTGTLKVVLKHQPGIKDGSSTTGETDVELVFELEVQ